MKTYAILLDSNKTPQVIEFTAEQDTDKRLDYFYETIGCEYIDIVHTSLKDTCIVVDDEGLYKEPLEINVIASLLYGYQVHGQPIVGKGLLTAEICTMNGAECVGFEKNAADALAAALVKSYKPFLNVNA
jgi:hypothetical protein